MRLWVRRRTNRRPNRKWPIWRGRHPRSALFNVFRHRNYRLFFSGQLVSLMGTWMQSVAQGWLVYSLTHSPFLLGLTSFCAQVTVFFMAPFGGMIADRVDRRRMLIMDAELVDGAGDPARRC